MKMYKKPATSKLVMRFDNELKSILSNDLKAFMARNLFLGNKQANGQRTLSIV